MATASVSTKKANKKTKKAKSEQKVFTFEWKGLNRDGNKTNGEIQASSVAEARALLKQQGIATKSVRKKSKSLLSGEKPIKPMDIAMVTRQIATMLSAGVPLVTTIEMLAKGHEKPKMRNLLGGILNDLQAGIPLSEAFTSASSLL